MNGKTATNVLITSSTTTASIMAMSKVLNPAIAIASATSLVSHEFGHYYSAKLRDADPTFPIVIPAGIASIGITSISTQLSKRSRRYILKSGPIAGIVSACSLIPFAIMTSTISMSILFLIIAGEIYSWTFGADGAKLKKLDNE